MAARAASVPRFQRAVLGLETCHWLARKQKPTNQRKASEGWGWHRGQAAHVGREGRWGGGYGKKTEEPGGSRGTSPRSPPTEGEEVGGQSAGARGSTGEEQRGRPDPEQERPRGRRGGQARDQSQEGGSRRGETGEGDRRKVSEPLGPRSKLSQHRLPGLIRLTRVWSSLRPAALL